MRSPDLAHAAFANQGGDFIGAEAGSGGQGHLAAFYGKKRCPAYGLRTVTLVGWVAWYWLSPTNISVASPRRDITIFTSGNKAEIKNTVKVHAKPLLARFADNWTHGNRTRPTGQYHYE
jgi:hypothetical protein